MLVPQFGDVKDKQAVDLIQNLMPEYEVIGAVSYTHLDVYKRQEADPTADVEGYDAGRKIAIMASIAFNSRVTFADVYTEEMCIRDR